MGACEWLEEVGRPGGRGGQKVRERVEAVSKNDSLGGCVVCGSACPLFYAAR
jgi:hypothetical protein